MQRELLEIQDIASVLDKRRAGEVLEIEIGCGNGHFLAEYCEKRRDRLLLGIDRKKGRCLKAVKKVNHSRLSNVFILYGRAEELIEVLADSTVRAYHIYFPDPWPKNRHRRRRFFRMEHLRSLYRSLEPGGSIYFCSDFHDYYLQAKVLLALHGGFSLGEVPPSDEVFRSLFSRRLMAMGKTIYFTAGCKQSREA